MKMKKRQQAMLLIAALLSSVSLFAETWKAGCNDGKNIHYEQTLNGSGFLFMSVKMPNGTMETFQIARLVYSFSNDVAICGAVEMNGITQSGIPITQICTNQNRQIIYTKSKRPNQPFVSGRYCSADVEIIQ